MSGLTHSETLRLNIRLAERQLVDPLTRFRRHPQFKDVFSTFLFRLHCSVRASVPLLQAAHRRCTELAGACPVAAALAPYYDEHTREEMHHDEWLLEDMTWLGIDRNEVLTGVPPPDVAAMVGAQYYWIGHAHPVALLAYLAVVEGNPPTVAALDDLVASTGVPQEALRTFYRHARLDIAHAAELWALLDRLPLLPTQSTLLGLNAILVIGCMRGIIEGAMERPRAQGES